MDVADDAEDLAGDGPDVVDDGEDLAEDTEDFPGDTAEELTAAEGQADEPGAGFGEAPEEPAEPRPSTGEPRVDAALARLDELKGRPVNEHRAVFEDVHRRLRDVLGELDSRQQPPPRDANDAAGRPGR
jgi:hypothetical protein